MVKKIINIVLWLIVLAWVGLVLYDYYNVSQEKDPVFCLSTETIPYDDGTVTQCNGLGYKAYKYQRTGHNYKQSFGPFWGKDLTAGK